jgi:hypothetical protein
MSARKFGGLILSSLMLIGALCLPSTHRLQHSQELLGNPSQTQRADGGGPVPPLPPPSFLDTLTADGGGPVPPLPPPAAASLPSLIRQSPLPADGGGPVPPLPPPNTAASLPSTNQQSPLLADGGGPVPPLPPPSFLNTLTADGGGPVPPLPPPCLNAVFLAA